MVIFRNFRELLHYLDLSESLSALIFMGLVAWDILDGDFAFSFDLPGLDNFAIRTFSKQSSQFVGLRNG